GDDRARRVSGRGGGSRRREDRRGVSGDEEAGARYVGGRAAADRSSRAATGADSQSRGRRITPEVAAALGPGPSPALRASPAVAWTSTLSDPVTTSRRVRAYERPRRRAKSATLLASASGSGTAPSGVIRSTTSGSNSERPCDASSGLMPACRAIVSRPSFPKTCDIASGEIGLLAPRLTQESGCWRKLVRWSCSRRPPRPRPAPPAPPSPCPSRSPRPPLPGATLA